MFKTTTHAPAQFYLCGCCDLNGVLSGCSNTPENLMKFAKSPGYCNVWLFLVNVTDNKCLKGVHRASNSPDPIFARASWIWGQFYACMNFGRNFRLPSTSDILLATNGTKSWPNGTDRKHCATVHRSIWMLHHRPLSRAAVRFPAGAKQIRLARRPAPTKIWLAAAPNFSGGGIRRQLVSVHIKIQIK